MEYQPCFSCAGSPVLLIAYRRVLPFDRSPEAPMALNDRLPAVFGSPSSPSPVRYSSFVPSTISGLASPVMFPTAGVSMIAPCGVLVRSSPLFPVLAKLNAMRWVVGSIVEILSWSTTSTG